MAFMENRNGRFRIKIYFDGKYYSRTLKTKSEQKAGLALVHYFARSCSVGLATPIHIPGRSPSTQDPWRFDTRRETPLPLIKRLDRDTFSSAKFGHRQPRIRLPTNSLKPLFNPFFFALTSHRISKYSKGNPSTYTSRLQWHSETLTFQSQFASLNAHDVVSQSGRGMPHKVLRHFRCRCNLRQACDELMSRHMQVVFVPVT